MRNKRPPKHFGKKKVWLLLLGNRLIVVKVWVSPAHLQWLWILWGRGWSPSSVGAGYLAVIDAGWHWSQDTSSWPREEVGLVASSYGVRCPCQSDKATGARCAPGVFGNSRKQKEMESLKWWNEEKKTWNHSCSFLHWLLPLTCP